jgi:glutaredoxin
VWEIFRYLWPSRAGSTDLSVLLYTRRGCHLCEATAQTLERQRRRWRFTLREVDVDSDPELAARYGDCVPVVAVNGRVRFRGQVNGALLTRLLRAESRR